MTDLDALVLRLARVDTLDADLAAAGVAGHAKALRTYDPARGRWGAFLRRRVRHEVSKVVRARARAAGSVGVFFAEVRAVE